MTILDDAAKAVESRGTSYGTPADNHGRTAAMWAAYLGVPVTAHDVCMLNILQKASRAKCDPGHRDNLVDIAGYARNAEMIRESLSAAVMERGVAFKFVRPCGACGAPIVPHRAVCQNAEGNRYDAVVWRCRPPCKFEHVEDTHLQALSDPDYLRI